MYQPSIDSKAAVRATDVLCRGRSPNSSFSKVAQLVTADAGRHQMGSVPEGRRGSRRQRPERDVGQPVLDQRTYLVAGGHPQAGLGPAP
ncbi:hypothetical protein AB0A91_10780 [Streptomyces sp. NPDC042207]|uniref:hypothetical protein n=1 Tax=Streptomyces sp. NPDC042207 TaxID=3154331 RepID=UPI003410045D